MRPNVPATIGRPVLYCDGGSIPVPGVVTKVWDADTGLVNIKLFRDVGDTRDPKGDVTSVPYSDRAQAHSWSDPQPF